MRRYLLVAASAALLLAPISAQEAPDGSAQLLRQRIGALTLTVSIRPTVETQDLRSVQLHVPDVLMEPHVHWPNGTPASASAQIRERLGLALIGVLERSGFFENSRKFYSERSKVSSGYDPPSDASPYASALAEPQAPGYDHICVVFDDRWYTYHVATYNMPRADQDVLRQLIGELSGRPAELLSKLERQLR